MMSGLGNIVWIVFGGFLVALGYLLGGILLCLTIIGIPFGLVAFQMAGASLVPFGKQVTTKTTGSGFVAQLFNVLWLVLLGWEIALTHLLCGLFFTITLIGIPLAKQHFKMIPVALLPFSYRLE